MALSVFPAVMGLYLRTGSTLLELPWFLALIASTVWIVYRVSLVFQTPVEELEEILGIDIPPVPDIALSSITSNSVLLYWKSHENYHSPLRNVIQINGINVGEFDRSDNSVQLTGLTPGNYYGIRAIATNATGNSSYSRFIQVQTIPLDGHRGEKILANLDPAHGLRGRRISDAESSEESTSESSEEDNDDSEEEESVSKLTKKLDSLRRQKDEADRELSEEVGEADGLKATLTKERDELKRAVEEKDKNSQDFRKQVNELEKQSKAAQRKKSAKERTLQQKKAERQKTKDDIARWEQESIDMENETETMRGEIDDLEDAHSKRVAETQKLIESAQADSRTLEEEIREWGTKIKALEEERQKAHQDQNEEEKEAERREKEADQTHESRVQMLQAEYATLWKYTNQAEREWLNAQEELAYWIQQRAKYPTKFAPIPGIDYPMQLYQPMQRRARQGNSRNSAHSSINYSSGHTGMNSSVSNVSPIFPSAFPYFGLNHGPGSPNHGPISIHDIDALTAGAPMSPSANNFLPSGLLGDDELPGDGFLPAMYDRNLAIAQSYGQNAADQDPQSPISVTSQSPSLVSSPQESLSNIHGIYSLGDSERRSLGSTGSPYSHGMTASSNAGHSRRFGNLFNFNRQRGKNGIDDLPALGTLKSTQSQSFPLNLDQDPGASGSGRRKLTSSVWPNSMTSFLTRGGSVPIEDGDGGGTRKARRGVFGTKLEHLEPLTTVDRSPSPRPSSTYSHDRALPRPASDVNPLFGWPVNEASQQRSSPLGADWGSIGGGWSRNQSRRQSLQHGSTSNLSIGTTPLEIDDYASPYNAKTSQPAPIGTGRFKRSATPKLNPAAPTFTARFFARESRKTPKHEKAQELQRTASFDKLKSRTSRELADPAFLSEDSSPPVSRLSRDAHSVNTTASVADSHDSLDHTISATASETTGTSSSTPKESLMQKITRKSSSSKFVPWSKERSSIFSKKAPGEPSTPGEIDEDASSDYIGNGLLPAVPTTPNPDKAPRGSLSWSRVMGKNKGKKGEVAPSETSEMTASETDGAEEEDADVIAS